jgi:hypothetical protein
VITLLRITLLQNSKGFNNAKLLFRSSFFLQDLRTEMTFLKETLTRVEFQLSTSQEIQVGKNHSGNIAQ